MNGFSNKVYKGFTTYAEAHQVWHAFINHNTLSPDILLGLHGRPCPLPPPPDIGGTADPSSPTCLQSPMASGGSLQPVTTPFVHDLEAFGMLGASRMRPQALDGLAVTLEATLAAATLSPSAATPEPSTQNPNTQAGSSGKQRASDAEDFWVVLTGANPGVYQGQ